MDIYVKKKQVYISEITGIDYDLVDEFKDASDTNDDHQIVFIGKETNDCDTTEISIERLKALLKQSEERGATHICIDYHGDHTGYLIEGLALSKATTDEIENYHKESKKISIYKNSKTLNTLDENRLRIYNKVVSIIVDCCSWVDLGKKSIEPQQVTLLSTITELGLDSLDSIEVIMNVEEAFNFSISDDKLESIKTVKDLCDLVEELEN